MPIFSILPKGGIPRHYVFRNHNAKFVKLISNLHYQECGGQMLNGCVTALITPMKNDGSVDYRGLKRFVEFQLENGITGLLAVGTTGECPTLTWKEHNRMIEKTVEYAGSKCAVIAGTGSNNTSEAIEATRHAMDVGAKGALLVDPYYNGPSSLEIRKEYIAPIAARFPEMELIPYIIPGRTGTQLLPQDLAILSKEHANVRTVKEATGNVENMRLTRRLCGGNFTIISGDDDRTYSMMTDPLINAAGVISVASNIAPGTVKKMTEAVAKGKREEGKRLADMLSPLFGIITVKTEERTAFGNAHFRARNPLATKTLMNVLGAPSGPCRQPMGKLTRNALDIVMSAARKVQSEHPEIFEPIGDFFDVSIEKRLANPRYQEGLCYAAY